MSLSRRALLRLGAAAVGSAAALSAACAPAAPTGPTAAPTLAPGGGAASTQPAAAAPASPAPAIAAASPSPALVPSPSAVAAAASAAGGPLKIGVLVPYTESSVGVDIGLNQKRAADLYLKHQGGKLGGRAASLVYSSESVEAGINKTKVRTLLETEKVQVLLGGASAETAYVMRDAAEAAKLVYLDTNASANALTRRVADCKPSCASKYVFRTSATSWQLGQPLGEWASKNGAAEFFVCYVDDTFGSESADAFEAGLTRNGGTVTTRSPVQNGADWSKVIGSIKDQSTHNVFAALVTDDAEGFVSEWDKQGLREAGFQLYGPGMLTEPEVLTQTKSAAEGILTSHFWSSELSNPENKALVDAFPKEYTDDETGLPVMLGGYAVGMWDAMTALDSALKTTGGDAANADALIAALEGTSFASPRGTFTFDRASHNPVQNIYIREASTSNGALVNAIRDTVAGVADPGA